jgi:hypothetical protein
MPSGDAYVLILRPRGQRPVYYVDRDANTPYMVRASPAIRDAKVSHNAGIAQGMRQDLMRAGIRLRGSAGDRAGRAGRDAAGGRRCAYEGFLEIPESRAGGRACRALDRGRDRRQQEWLWDGANVVVPRNSASSWTPEGARRDRVDQSPAETPCRGMVIYTLLKEHKGKTTCKWWPGSPPARPA